MQTKEKEKVLAIRLRKQGKTYSEILKQVPVAKSTLSLWLRDVGLAERQERLLTEKMRLASLRGGARKRDIRIEKTRLIHKEAIGEIGKLTKRELWLMGTMLYWAEGTKEKENNRSVGVEFANSDTRMIQVYLKWLLESIRLEKERITFGVFIHENSRSRIREVIKYWARETGFPESAFTYTYFKKHNPKTRRKFDSSKYNGLLRVRVSASSDINRKIAGWVTGVVNRCGIV